MTATTTTEQALMATSSPDPGTGGYIPLKTRWDRPSRTAAGANARER